VLAASFGGVLVVLVWARIALCGAGRFWGRFAFSTVVRGVCTWTGGIRRWVKGRLVPERRGPGGDGWRASVEASSRRVAVRALTQGWGGVQRRRVRWAGWSGGKLELAVAVPRTDSAPAMPVAPPPARFSQLPPIRVLPMLVVERGRCERGSLAGMDAGETRPRRAERLAVASKPDPTASHSPLGRDSGPCIVFVRMQVSGAGVDRLARKGAAMSVRKNPIACLALLVALGGMSYVAVGVAAASAGGRAASAGCYPKGSYTIAQDKVGRFYVLKTHRPGGGFPQPWYVCAFSRGTSWKLPYGNPDRGTPFGPSAKVSGRYVAFLVGAPGPGGVAVFDLATGQRTFSGGAGGGGIGPDPVDAALVLKADGSVAWTTHDFAPWVVRRHDSTGTATLDSGPGIDTKSLAAGGSWLYWTDAGSPRSARFR
jgi:hypothetical protein